MYSRLLTAAMRLLPTAMNQSPDNPVQLDRLPKDHAEKVEFDYPVVQETSESAARRTAIGIFLVALATPLLAWWNEYLAIPYVQGGMRLIVMLAATGLAVFGVLANRWPLPAVGAALIAVWFQATLSASSKSGLAVLFPFFVAAIILGDRLAGFYIYLKTACPVPISRARKVRHLFQARFKTFRKPLRGAELYLLGFLPAVLAVLFLMRPLAHDAGDRGFAKAAIFSIIVLVASLTWTFLVELTVAPMFGRRPFSPQQLIQAFIRAGVQFCSYNRLGTEAVGIHRSPAGSCTCRKALLFGVLLLAASTWVAMLPHRDPSGLGFWETLYKADLAFSVGAQLLSDGELRPKPRSAAPSEPLPLEPYEQEMIARLSPGQREAFLAERKRVHQEQAIAAERRAQRDADSARAGKAVSEFLLRAGKAAINLLLPAFSAMALAIGPLFSIAARSLAGIESLYGDKTGQRVLASENWNLLVTRVRESEDKIEKHSVFLGTLAKDDTPVLVPRDVFKEHAHILGDSGAGKTSMGLLPLMTQLMRFKDCSLIVIDLKADDQTVFENIKHEAAECTKALKAPYRFRWFTNMRNRSTYAFNPFTQRCMSQLALDQKTDFLTASLGLVYGTDYGRKFYGDANYDVLNFAIQQNPGLESFGQLADVLEEANRFPLHAETKRAASHIRSSTRRLARIQALNVTASNTPDPQVFQDGIDFADFFTVPQVAYFALPPASGISTTAEIARLVLYSLLTAAQLHSGERKQVFLVIDEFQRIVANNLAIFLQTARSMGIGVILANQSLSDLETVDATLVAATRTNCRFRQVFGVGEPQDIEDIQATAGEFIGGLRTFTGTTTLFGGLNIDRLAVSETPLPRLSQTDILLATDKAGRSISSIRRGEGYAQYGGMHFVMDSVHHIDPDTYKERRELDWPSPVPGTMLAAIDEPLTPPSPGGATVISDDDPGPINIDLIELLDETGYPPPTFPSKRSEKRKKNGKRGESPEHPPLPDLLQ